MILANSFDYASRGPYIVLLAISPSKPDVSVCKTYDEAVEAFFYDVDCRYRLMLDRDGVVVAAENQHCALFATSQMFEQLEAALPDDEYAEERRLLALQTELVCRLDFPE